MFGFSWLNFWISSLRVFSWEGSKLKYDNFTFSLDVDVFPLVLDAAPFCPWPAPPEQPIKLPVNNKLANESEKKAFFKVIPLK